MDVVNLTFENKLVKLVYEKNRVTITWKYLKKPIVLNKTASGCFECVSHSKTHNGYPKITFNGTTRRLNRFMFCLINGVSYESLVGFVMLHECDNRTCVNPHHLTKGTHAENMQDMCDKGRQANGSRLPQSKFNEDNIVEIRGSKAPVRKLANAYGVSKQTIRNIQRGYTWKHL